MSVCQGSLEPESMKEATNCMVHILDAMCEKGYLQDVVNMHCQYFSANLIIEVSEMFYA